MTSLKGWLSSSGPDEPPRITQSQKDVLLRSLRAVCEYTERAQRNSGCQLDTTLALSIVNKAVENYPTDRSCVTCDYFTTDGHCRYWEWQKIPAEYVERGCDEWKDEDSPF